MQLLAPVLIVEDELFMQQRLQSILMDIGYQASDLLFRQNLAHAHQATDFSQIALALIDLGLPDGSGISLIQELSQAHSELPILVISAWSTEQMIIDAIQAGATGYILKERDDLELNVSIRSILKGGAPIDPFLARHILNKLPVQGKAPDPSHDSQAASNDNKVLTVQEEVNLTEREYQILNLVASGLSNQEIAEHIFLSRHTVETHIRHVYRKLAVTNRTKAISRAREIGLL